MSRSIRTWRAYVCAALMAMATSSTHATIIDFDAYGVAQSSHSIVFPVNGFIFNTGMEVIDISPSAPPWLQITGPAHSGNYAAANNTSINWMQRADGATFSFSSLWVRQYAGLQPSEFTVIGIFNGVEVGRSTLTSSNNWEKLTANFSNIDTLLFQHESFWVIDDLLVNASPVPEPQGPTTLFLGIAMLFYAARRRNL